MIDNRLFDLNLLKALHALLEERNVTRAAARLGLTQPAVSGILVRLRESFGDPLFVRVQRGIVPTPRALELAIPVKQMLEDVEALLQPSRFDPLTARLTVSVAATDYAMMVAVVPLLARLRVLAPGIRVSVRPIENENLAAQFKSGELDLAFLTPDTTPPELHSSHLFVEDYVCAMREAHPDAKTGEISLDRFCELEHVLMSHNGQQFLGATDLALDLVERSRRVVASIPSFFVLLELLMQTDLIAIVPRRLASNRDQLAIVKPPVEIPSFTKVMVWHERVDYDPAQRWIREIVLELFASD